MRRCLLLSAALVLLASCASLPPITPITGAPPAGAGVCGRVFPEGKWQFLHSIRAGMPGGRSFVAMGLTVMSSRLRTNRSVIMTPEGFVVFDGEYDRLLTVHRALPPFDSPHFAGGLMDDIRLVFLAPEGPPIGFGESDTGAVLCRHASPDGGAVDVELHPHGGWTLRRYGPDQRLARTVRALPGTPDKTGFPATLELEAAGDRSYTLAMTLVEAVQIEP